MAASFCKLTMIGRLTNEPEIKPIGNNGARVASFGFAVTYRKKNKTTNEYEDDPMFIDCEAFNSGSGSWNLADVVEKNLRKGMLVHLECRLKLDVWQDKNGGGKRSKHRAVVEAITLLEWKDDNGGRQSNGGNRGRQQNGGQQNANRGGRQPNADPNEYGGGDDYGGYGDGGDDNEKIPF